VALRFKNINRERNIMNASFLNPSGAGNRLTAILRVAVKITAATAAILLCVLTAGSVKAQDAACYVNWASQWEARGDYDNAIADYNQAIAICPWDATSYNNRGYDYYKKGNFDQAIIDYTQALALCPNYGAAYSNRGVAWDEKGDHDRAAADFAQALAVDPNVAAAYSNRGVTEASHGQFEQANADFYRSLSIDPNFATGYENLGFFQATCPDPKYRNGKKAFENASRGYQLAPSSDAYYTHNSLAAAYAECGDFAKAQTWQAKVVELAPASDKPMMAARLELFKQGKPYRSVVKSS
jgi:tetratricopeptide (TPR) repeat protein